MLSHVDHLPIDKQVFLHAEAVGAAVAYSAVALGAPGGPGLPGVGGRVLVIAIQVREVASLAPQCGELTGLLPHPGRVNHQRVLWRQRER